MSFSPGYDLIIIFWKCNSLISIFSFCDCTAKCSQSASLHLFFIFIHMYIYVCIYRVFVAYLLHVLSPISPWPICSCKVCAHGCFVSQCWPAPSGNRVVKIIATVRVNKGSILSCGSMRLSVGPDREVCGSSYAVTFKARHFSLQKENFCSVSPLFQQVAENGLVATCWIFTFSLLPALFAWKLFFCS